MQVSKSWVSARSLTSMQHTEQLKKTLDIRLWATHTPHTHSCGGGDIKNYSRDHIIKVRINGLDIHFRMEAKSDMHFKNFFPKSWGAHEELRGQYKCVGK